ncbi:hypothetical protein D9M68_624190 [compost metagenome]
MVFHMPLGEACAIAAALPSRAAVNTAARNAGRTSGRTAARWDGLRMMSPLRFVATGRCRCDAPRGDCRLRRSSAGRAAVRTPIYCRSRGAAIARHAAPISAAASSHGLHAHRKAASSCRLRVFVLQQTGPLSAVPKHSSKRTCGATQGPRGEIGKPVADGEKRAGTVGIARCAQRSMVRDRSHPDG